MDVIIDYLTCDNKSIQGNPLSEKFARDSIYSLIKAEKSSWSDIKQDFQNEDEYLFNAFNKLAVSAFNGLLKRNSQTEKENNKLREENKKSEKQYVRMKKELAEVKNKHEERKTCKTCISYEGERQQFEHKYANMEKQLKKCAFIINSSLDGGTKVLGRVREVLSQGMADSNDLESQDCQENLEPVPQPSTTSYYATVVKPILSLDDDDTTILAPSSPDVNDVETQAFGGPGEDHIICIPETVPFDHPKLQENIFRGRSNAPPNIIRKSSPVKSTVKKTVSPAQSGTPKKRLKLESPSMLDTSIYSPPLMEDFALPPVLLQQYKPNTQEVDLPRAKETSHSLKTKSEMFENVHPYETISKVGQRPLAEQQQTIQTPKSKRNKSLKQTKLTLNRCTNDVSPAVSVNANAVTRITTKTVRISPPANRENKRKRPGKEPEDWPCKECYRLFREAVAAKKVDVRKMPVSMNFCPEHFNRYSYYLNTPPTFWHCGIGKSPRNGHLHPLDASLANAEDDDDFVE